MITIEEALWRAGEALDANLRRSEADLELLITGNDSDGFREQIDLLIEQQRREHAIFRVKALADLEAWLRGGYRRDLH